MKPVSGNDSRHIIVALDFSSEQAALDTLSRLDPDLCRVKVGKELFTRCGPSLVRQINRQGYEVFLDLKFHDIPNTVAGAVGAAVDLGVWMVNVHAAGGRAMLNAARVAVENSSTLLTAVTVLTSLTAEDMRETGVPDKPEDQVRRLARLVADTGLHGVVCSAMETRRLRAEFGPAFVLVTPGIRLAGDMLGDQKRIATPADAIRDGSDYLVIGRPVTQASDPSSKLKEILAEIR